MDICAAKRLLTTLSENARVKRARTECELTREGSVVLFARNTLHTMLGFADIVALSIVSKQGCRSIRWMFKCVSEWEWLHDLDCTRLCEVVQLFDNNDFTILCARDPFLARKILPRSTCARIDVCLFVRACVSFDHGVSVLDQMRTMFDEFDAKYHDALYVLAAIFDKSTCVRQLNGDMKNVALLCGVGDTHLANDDRLSAAIACCDPSVANIKAMVITHGSFGQMVALCDKYGPLSTLEIVKHACRRDDCWEYVKFACRKTQLGVEECRRLLSAGKYEVICKAVDRGLCCPMKACIVACEFSCGPLFARYSDSVVCLLTLCAPV